MLKQLVWLVFQLIFRAVEWVLLWPFVLLRRRLRHFVEVSLHGTFKLSAPHGLFRPRRVATLANLRELAQELVRSPRLEGLVLRVRDFQTSPADALLLAELLQHLRASGKRVVCHYDSAGVAQLLLAAEADTVMIAPPGRLFTPGLGMELTFARPLLRRLGLRAQFLHIGRFKTAANTLTRDESSEAQRAMMTRLLHDLSSGIEACVVKDRAVQLFERPFWSPAAARQAGLVQHQAFYDQVSTRLRAEGDPDLDPFAHYGEKARARELKERLGETRGVMLQKRGAFLKRLPRRIVWPRLNRRFAVVTLNGAIYPDSAGSSPLGGRPSIRPEPVRKLLRRLRESRSVKGVVLAIDSPGGSALASDLIWHEVRRLRAKKPVVALMRSVAASGGYYIAVGAHEIVATRLTITGSIGIIGGKISIGGALERAPIIGETLTATPWATMFSGRHPFTAVQIEALRVEMREGYRRFIEKVAISRGMPKVRIHQMARGRVYSGPHARDLGLVDHIGGLEVALERLAALAEVPVAKAQVDFHSLERVGLRQLLTGGAGVSSQLPALLTPYADNAWAALELATLTQCDPVLAYFGGRLEV